MKRCFIVSYIAIIAILLVCVIQILIFPFERSVFIEDKFQIVGYKNAVLPKNSPNHIVELYRESTKENIKVRAPKNCKEMPSNKIVNVTLRIDYRQILFKEHKSYYLPFGDVCMK